MASIVPTNARSPGGMFVLHASALPGNPYDGHTLREAIAATEKLTGRTVERAYVARDTTSTVPPHAASSSQARNAACSASSNANCAAAPPSKRSSVT